MLACLRLSSVLAAVLWGGGLLVASVSCGGASVAPVAAPAAATAPEPAPLPVVRALPVGGTAMALLPDHVARYEGPTPIVEWRVQVTEPSVARIELLSSELDTVLRVRSPDGRQWRNDDWSGTNSMIQLFTTPGEWVIEGMPFDPANTGRMTVRWTEQVNTERIPTLRADARQTASVRPGGAGFPGPGREGSFWIDAQAGERIRVRVTSPNFDTTALLIGPGGQRWFNDDANDTGPDGTESLYDSTVVAVIGEAGRHQLVVRPFSESGAGEFSASLEVQPPVVVREGEETPATGYAGPDAEGRMFGIFLGIETYSSVDVLPGCDDDATFLARAFRERGLMRAADQIVLTDHKVTRQAFVDAVETLSARVGPNDTLVFFYSGHGGTLPVAEDDEWEIDGVDETLVFYDGQMVDHEVVRWLDRFDVGTLIMGLDSCQAGGFLRDFMTRPGRIALLSSDEDVLSSTAQPVGAGGYLSYAMREAVRRSGDQRPNDGALYAGEFTDALLASFQTHFTDMNPVGSHEPLQRLVMDRGSYNWSDLLWIYPRNEDGTFVGVDPGACAPSPMDVGAAAVCE